MRGVRPYDRTLVPGGYVRGTAGQLSSHGCTYDGGTCRWRLLPVQFTMHLFRVGGSLSKSLAVTRVDESIKIGGWKTESGGQILHVY